MMKLFNFFTEYKREKIEEERMIGMDNNAKGEDQKQETSIQRLKKQYPGLNVASGRFGHKKIGVNRFVVQEADGLRFVEEKDNAFVLIQKVSWSEFPQRLYMDKLFMKAFYYSDEKEEHSVFTISRTDDGDAICAEVQKRKQVTVKKRKAIQRIVGFRSGSIWKSAIAVSVYAFMLFFVIGLFVGNDDEAVAKPAPVKEEQVKDKGTKSKEETTKNEQETSAKTSSNEDKKETKSKIEAKESIFDINDVYGGFDDPNAVETVEDVYKNDDKEKTYLVADGVVFQTIKYFGDLNVDLLATTDFDFLINHAKDSMPEDVELKKTIKENKEFLYYSKSTKKDYIVAFGITENDHVHSVYVSQNTN